MIVRRDFEQSRDGSGEISQTKLGTIYDGVLLRDIVIFVVEDTWYGRGSVGGDGIACEVGDFFDIAVVSRNNNIHVELIGGG